MRPYKKIKGTVPLYIFENHKDVFVPWATIRRNLEVAPQLITFDTHTDTLNPFSSWAYWEAYNASGMRENARLRDKLRQERIALVDYRDDDALNFAADDLRHDEHICAALETSVISKAHVVAKREPSKKLLRSDIFYYPTLCYHECPKVTHDDECARARADLAIADQHLNQLLKCSDFFDVLNSGYPYILDIDLDYINTIKALETTNVSTFRHIASMATIVTIVTEPDCFKECCLDMDFTWGQALNMLLDILS